jgi:CRISPR-associated protein Csd2
MTIASAVNLESVVDRRYDFVLLFDVVDGNPNGDPDAGNMPRVDPETMQGFVTDACLKRKVRNYVQTVKTTAEGNEPGYGIYIQIQGVLNRLHQKAYNAKNIGLDDAKDPDKVAQARQYMCENFYDVRTFGAVMSTGVNCGQVRGPVQLTFSRSIDPIVPREVTVVRKAVTTENDAAKQIEKHGYVTGTMGRKNIVPYGLYRGHGFVNSQLARDTGFNYADLKLLFESLINMFEMDRSASRGLMSTRRLYVFEHESHLGNAPAHQLFDLLTIQPRGSENPARQFDDYADRIQFEQKLPPGIVAYELPQDLLKMFGE